MNNVGFSLFICQNHWICVKNRVSGETRDIITRLSGYATERVRIEPLGGGTPQQPVQFVGKLILEIPLKIERVGKKWKIF